jgi:hypothetical protein
MRTEVGRMHDLIARTAGVVILLGFVVVALWYRLHLPVPKPIKRWTVLQRLLFLVGVLIFLMLVIDWATQNR